MQEKLKREIITTSDGSTTIYFPELNEHYHSKHGAINEAEHVFIKNGLDHYLENNDVDQLRILEIGFGTGLNAFITFLNAVQRNQKVNYVGVEAYPIQAPEIEKLNYLDVLKSKEYQKVFDKMHQEPWGEWIEIMPLFELNKRKQLFSEINDICDFDLVYFDAFGARVQPELWTEVIFQKMYDALDDYGVLVTYAAKGSVRRAMQAVGFVTERLPGPPGKREMLRATKNVS